MTAHALAFALLLPLSEAGAQMPPGMPAPPPPESGSAAPAPAPAVNPAHQPAPRKPKSKAPAVDESSGAAKALGVDDIYGGAKFRDPFMKLAGSGVQAAPVAAAAKEFDPDEFSIHQLELKGIMRDKAGWTALLVDMNTRLSFLLRGGRLYDLKKKAVPGVTGVVKPAEKTVVLTTADKDVQTLKLGEDADEAEE